MAPLYRTLALEQVHRVTVMVGEDLDLDMSWAFEKSFDVQRAVAKGGDRFPPGGARRLTDFGRLVHTSHALAAATG
jgi:hypothetical protein